MIDPHLNDHENAFKGVLAVFVAQVFRSLKTQRLRVLIPAEA